MLLSTSIPLDGVNWTAMGPAPIANGQTPGNQPVTGRLVALAADPSDATGNTIYVAAASGGVWKTTDGGAGWVPLTDTQPALFMGALALAPSNPTIIYAGTGEANTVGDSFYGRGVLKSTDGGASWTLLDNPQFYRRSIAKIVVDPSDPNTVYAAVGPGFENGFAGNAGIWKSTNGGITWANTTAGLPNLNLSLDLFSDLVLDPGDAGHQTLYMGVCSPFGNFSLGSGVYKTIDGGNSWTLLRGGLPSGATVGRIALAISPTSPQTLYTSIIGTGRPGSTTFGSLFKMMRTADGGATWQELTSTPNYVGTQGWYDTTLVVDPTNPDMVYAGGSFGRNTVIMSTDGGTRWSDISAGVDGNGPHADHHAIGFDAKGNLLDGNDGGIWRLDDPNPASLTWTDVNGNLQITQLVGIALHPSNMDIAYGGSQDNGTSQFNDAYAWTLLRAGDGGFVRVDANNPHTVYHEYQRSVGNGFLERSDDGGLAWTAKTSGINVSGPASFYIPYVMDAANSFRLLLGTNRVYETTDSADHWVALSTPNAGGWTVSDAIDSVAAAPTNPDTIYASTENGFTNGHIFVTFNHGASWQQRDIPGVVDRFQQLLVDPSNDQIAYAVRSKFDDMRFGIGHVFRTMDGGLTWTNISGNLSDLPTYSIALDPGFSPATLYVGNDAGVYVSTDLGASWTAFGVGLPNVQVRGLELNTGLGILAAGTYGRGMWQILVNGPSPPGAGWAFLRSGATLTDPSNTAANPAPLISLPNWHGGNASSSPTPLEGLGIDKTRALAPSLRGLGHRPAGSGAGFLAVRDRDFVDAYFARDAVAAGEFAGERHEG